MKKMGFPNLSGFKLALARELTESSHRYIINNNIEAGESALETGRKLLDVNIGTLEKTLESLSDGVIERCAALMCAAKRLQFIGLGNSGFIAQDSAYKFYRIGLESFGLDNGHSMMIMAALARPGDVVAAVSHSGHSPEVLKAVRLAKENGATIIAITANRTSPLCEISNLVVPYQAEETLLETGENRAVLDHGSYLYPDCQGKAGDGGREQKAHNAGREPAAALIQRGHGTDCSCPFYITRARMFPTSFGGGHEKKLFN